MVFSTRDERRGSPTGWYRRARDHGRQTRHGRPGGLRRKDRYLRLPEGIPGEIAELAARVTRGAATPYEQAIQLQEWFTKKGGFTYSLATRGHATRR